MSNLAVLPVVIPFLAGILATFFHKRITIVRVFSQIATIISLGVSLWITYYVSQYGTVVLEMGAWQAPYGIVFVADMLAISLVVAINVVATACVFYAPVSLTEEKERFFFYTFYFLLLTGVAGAFLTGDLFNLFVFFEVLLIASYGLIVLGNERVQLRESLKYVLLNLFSSMLFVTAIAFIYSVVGTVNMAQIAERVQVVEQHGILTTIAVLLFFVFATKAAIFPLYYWLPKSYAVPNPVVSALFGALLTKVGIYSILRAFTLIFVHDPEITHQLFLWLAALTMLLGAIGALSTHNVKLIVTYNIIPAVGFMLLGIGLLSETGVAGSVYYLIHDIIIKAALFLIIGAIVALMGTSNLKQMGGFIHHYPFLGWSFFIATLVLAGIPPFSGFIGKLLLIQGGVEQGEFALVIIALFSSLLILLSLMRIFIRGIWGEKDEEMAVNKPLARKFATPVAFLLIFSILLGIGAEWFYPHVELIANELLDPNVYINSILKE
ncbi:Na+/H+ antiporter subunit D [Salirhabdus salicampi]|uniref:Na+/H+ antiporter subunit D n=1 Tax=Salirhabdus salicampi TaxID=476102 RepID=UPI0020C340A0|nr:Na+/H+ antiporter subunit D [Salirhabdus salicampi]MCP8616940.1 Na+/H+ antiporter subunit D [Salirhabdus salicampi]